MTVYTGVRLAGQCKTLSPKQKTPTTGATGELILHLCTSTQTFNNISWTSMIPVKHQSLIQRKSFIFYSISWTIFGHGCELSEVTLCPLLIKFLSDLLLLCLACFMVHEAVYSLLLKPAHRPQASPLVDTSHSKWLTEAWAFTFLGCLGASRKSNISNLCMQNL